MTTENKELKEGQIEEVVVDERQYTDDEIKAMDHGWVPKDQWKGHVDEWIPAKVFNMRGELFSRIAKDKATISQMRESLDALVEHNKKIGEVAYKKALEDLKRDKRAALEDGDTSAVMRIDDEIEELRDTQTKEKEEFEKKVNTANQRQIPVEFEQFLFDNPWYQTDASLRAYADEVGVQIVQQANQSGITPNWNKLYQEVSRKVRSKFPERFENRTRKSAQEDIVDTGEGRSSTKPASNSTNTLKESDLNDDQRRIMNNILKTTKMKKEDYLKQMSEFEQRKNRR